MTRILINSFYQYVKYAVNKNYQIVTCAISDTLMFRHTTFHIQVYNTTIIILLVLQK